MKRRVYATTHLEATQRASGKAFTVTEVDEKMLLATFATSTYNNIIAALALPHVLARMPLAELDAQEASGRPIAVVEARKALLIKFCSLCKLASAIVTANRLFVVANWYDAVMPAAFAMRQDVRIVVSHQTYCIFTCQRTLTTTTNREPANDSCCCLPLISRSAPIDEHTKEKQRGPFFFFVGFSAPPHAHTRT